MCIFAGKIDKLFNLGVMKTKYYFLSGALIALTLAGCSKEVYDEHAIEEKQKSTFEENFAKAYPSVDLNQSWDFSTGQDIFTLPSSGAGSRALTRANGYTVTTGDFTLDGTIADYMHNNMKAGANNRGKGNPFGMKVPENPFTIVPIFQGQATYVWELWMYVETIGDIKVWSKGEDLSYEKGGVWTTFTPGKYEWIPDDGVTQIKSKSYTFSGLPVGKTMYFYLKVTNKNNKIESSLNQMMLTLKNFPPVNIPAEHEATIVGCEDNPSGDWDYEDLVFMVYGKPVPPDYVIKERIIENGKRYMMEDLGTTDDFDFNDVVVDVVSRTKEILSYEVDSEGHETYVGVKSKETLPSVARVRAMGGTMDFTLTIGNTDWTKSTKFDAGTMYNTKNINFNTILDEFEVDNSWTPSNNKVSVTVAGKNNNPGVSKGMTIKFPNPGETPLMIAFDTDREWMTERTGIPENWLKRE